MAEGRGSEPSFEARWRRKFENFAAGSDDDAGIAGWSARGLEIRLRNFTRLFGEGPFPGTWLDAGCGAGTYCRFLRERGARVAGIDYSFPSLRKAAERDRFGIPWINADVTRLPVRAGAFDGALCLGVMQALTDSRAAVAELCRALRPGGRICIDALNAACIVHRIGQARRKLRGAPMHLRYETAARMAALLRENGMSEIQCHWVPILPARLAWMQGTLETPAVRWLLRRIPPLGSSISHAFWVTARRP